MDRGNETHVPIMLINLCRDRDRLQRMTARYDAAGLSFERVPAVLGAALSAAERAALCPDRRLWWRAAPLADGEIGCFASHLEAWRRIAAGTAPIVCVMEDDVILEDQGVRLLRAAADAARGNDVMPVGIMRLEGSSHRLPRPGIGVGILGGRTVRVYGLPAWRTGAYLVTRDAAAQLLQTVLPMTGPLDQVMFEPWRTGLATGEIRPFPMHQESGSTIAPDLEGGIAVRAHPPSIRGRFLRLALALVRTLRGHVWLLRNARRLRRESGKV